METQQNQNQILKFLDPDAIIAQLEITSDCVVADFGCGPGYFTFPLAKKVASAGKVYSFDILPQVIETIESKARNLGLDNITVARANLEKDHGSKLEDASVDVVVMKDVLFQNKNKEIMIQEAYRVLREGGRALVVEWNANNFGFGPSNELRIAEDQLKNVFKSCGFEITSDIRAGEMHYAFVATK